MVEKNTSAKGMSSVKTTSAPSTKFDFGFISFILVLILFVLLLLAACCAAGYFFYRKKQQKLKPELSKDVESAYGDSQLPLRNHSKHLVDRPRPSSRQISPSSRSLTESSSDESPPLNRKGRVTHSEAYPAKVTSNRNGDKEIKIKGLPTGSLVFVVRNKRSHSSSTPSVKKRFSETTVVKNSSVKSKKVNRKEKLPSVSTTASQSSVVSSADLSTKTPPKKSAPASSSTVSLTKAKKAAKRPSKSQNCLDLPELTASSSSQPSVSPTSYLIDFPSEKSSVSSTKPSQPSLRSVNSEDFSTNVAQSTSSLQDATPMSFVNESVSSSRDLKVSPDNWSFKSAFTTLPAILKEPAEGERDIRRTSTTWKTNVNGNPVEGRTDKYTSRRVSVAHPKHMAQPFSLNGVLPKSQQTRRNRDKKFFGSYSPPLSLSEKNTQSGSPRLSPDLVDKTQSSSSGASKKDWTLPSQIRSGNGLKNPSIKNK